MANGHGGRRAGAGAKPKTALEHAITGDAGRRGRVLNHPSSSDAPATALVEVEEFDAPDDLTMEQRHVWLKLAPHAFKARTLTRATELAFSMLCRNIALEKRYAESVTDQGSANHRGLIQRIDAELSAFNLRPAGKPIFEAEAPATLKQASSYW